MQRFRFALLCAVAALIGLAANSTPLAEDPIAYRARVETVFGGRLPYVDGTVEHLPVAFGLMILVWLMGGFLSGEVYTLLFAVAAGFLLYGTARTASRISETLGRGPAFWRVGLLAGPLLPLVLFRNDVLAVFALVLALAAWVEGSMKRSAVWTVVGTAAKGWPIVMAVGALWRRSWTWFIGVVGFAVALITFLVFTPGFQSGREFSGLHAESTLGAAIGLGRTLAGEGSTLHREAGAFYVDAPLAALWGQVAVGGALILVALWVAARGPYSHDRLVRLVSVLIAAILLGSPLFSAQFLIWLLPLLAIEDDVWIRGAGLVSAVLTIAYLFAWNWLTTWPTAWFALVEIRNIVLLAIALRLVGNLRGRRLRPTGVVEDTRMVDQER